MSACYNVRAVERLGGHRRRLTFADGLIGDVDLTSKFGGHLGPVFEPLRHVAYFAQVSVNEGLAPSFGRTVPTSRPKYSTRRR